MEPILEPQFHPDSYGYRPGRSALDAVARVRRRCWDYDWVIEFDFDRQITNIWNATITSHVGNHYVIRAESWNKKIAANGGSVSFGFQGASGNVLAGPINIKLNGAIVS